MADNASRPQALDSSAGWGPRRYVILVAAVVMQTCLGATYSWSVFVGSLKPLTGLGQGTAQLPFSVFYVAFPAMMILSGSLLGRLGPRRCAVLGGLAFGAGWMLAGLGRIHFAFTVAGVGLVGGIGVGMAYIVPIATCMLWFPRNKGLVTGVAVAGFGGGAALVAQTAEYLMVHRGVTPFHTFVIYGVIFVFVVVLAGAAMRNPPRHQPQARGSECRDVLRDRFFHVLYLAMLAGLAAGFAINANLKQLCPFADSKTGALAVALFAVANAAGRISWGLLFDRLGSGGIIRANLAAQAVVCLASPWLLRSPTGLLCLGVLAGFNYGGVLVLYASSAAQRWGPERVGPVYGWLFSSNIAASAAPLLTGMAFDQWGSFTVPLVGLAVILGLAILLVGRPAERPLSQP